VPSRLTCTLNATSAPDGLAIPAPEGLRAEHSQISAAAEPPVAVAVVTALSAPILYLAHTDYRAWLRLGRGGLPNNAFGWLIQLLLTPLRAPRLDTSCYSNPKIVDRSGPAGTKSYLSSEDVPQRPGPRPTIHPWILPHRQADSWASAEWKTVSRLFHLTLFGPLQLSLSLHTFSLCHFTHSLSVTPPLFLSHPLYQRYAIISFHVRKLTSPSE
jgi:hypothetical protein